MIGANKVYDTCS